LSDRAGDAWEPLLAIADCVGGEWPERARGVATLLSAQDDQLPSLGERLLSDIRALLDTVVADRIFCADLTARLADIEGSPWADWRSKFTVTTLAKLLRPYGIKPATVRKGAKTAKGYRRDQFADAWARYLPLQPSQPSHAAAAEAGDESS